MVDGLSGWIVGGLAAAGSFAGWRVDRRHHRREMNRLLASTERKASTMLGRLAEARAQVAALKQETAKLQRELVQQRSRLLHAAMQRPAPAEALPVRAGTWNEDPVQGDEPSGFPDTQPWERGSP